MSSQLSYNAACSVPLGGMKKDTFFNCDEDLSSANVGDVPVTLCVKSADASIPDNPSSSDQSQSASKANLSNTVCDSITIDRTAPSVAIDATATSVAVGDLVAFTAQASDATSGVSGTYAWTFGDNTSPGAGGSVSHTFTAPGTYEVAAVTTDNAGNEATAKKVITVNARPTPVSTGGGSASGSGVTPVPPKVEGRSQSTDVGRLDVVAPKRVKLTSKTKTLAVALTAGAPGRASLALVRAGRIAAQGTATLAGAGTVGYKLKLPKKLKAGVYQLKVTFAGRTKTIKITFTGPATKRKARAAVTVPLVDAASAPTGLPTGAMPDAPRTRSVNFPVR